MYLFKELFLSVSISVMRVKYRLLSTCVDDRGLPHTRASCPWRLCGLGHPR